MKQLLFMAFLSITFFSCKNDEYPKNTEGDITWLTIDQAATLQNQDQKYYFVDIYTEWCGWCKRMDKTTFKEKSVIDALNANFHSVKFDAEQKEAINWQGQQYVFKAGGRKGINTLAPVLLKNRLSYPSFVILDSNRQIISNIVGYQKPEQLIAALNAVLR